VKKVSIVNINNGERFETYAIKGARNSGEITLNGPAAKSSKDDIIIIILRHLRVWSKNVQALDYFPKWKQQFFNLITISSKNVILTLQKTIDIIPIVFFF
jgi:aspartate 1-decarboxylase